MTGFLRNSLPSAAFPVGSFAYNQSPGRVLFGVDAIARVDAEVERLGLKRVIVLATPGQAERIAIIRESLGSLCVCAFDGAVMHVPIETTRAALKAVLQAQADGIVTVGGGSATGLGKAVALETGFPIIAIPTTYSGSEMTSLYGITDRRSKKTGRDTRVLPKTVIYDPALTAGLPVSVSVTSGMNAIAHAAEGLYAADGNPITAMFAQEGIRTMADGLRQVALSPTSIDARADCLYGAWLCGSVLGTVTMGLHHKLAHLLGGTWNLPHAETHTVLLPHVMSYNEAAAPDAMRRMARALESENVAQGLFDLATKLGAPRSLREIGMPEEDLAHAAELMCQAKFENPEHIEIGRIRLLLDDAFYGVRFSRENGERGAHC